VAAGIYGPQAIRDDPAKQGGKPVTFRPAPGAAVTLAAGVTLGGSHMAVTGMTVQNPTGDCITVAPGLTDLTIASNTIDSCGSDGIGFTRTSGTYTSGVLIDGNAISRVGATDRYGNGLTVFGNDVMVKDNDITGSPNDAVDLWGDHLTFRHNHIHDLSNTLGNHNDAFQTWTGTADGAEGNPVTNLVIEQNTVENIAGANSHCVMSEGPGHAAWIIRDNVFRGIGDQCMIFGKDGNGVTGIDGVRIHNNTFVSAGANNTIELNLTTTATVADNVFYNCVGYRGWGPYWSASTARTTADYNLSGGSSPKPLEPHGLYAEPGFAAAAANDFHLAAGSAAIDAGDNGALVSPPRAADLDGKPTTGAVDIGAYEYQG
jgi:serralysin